MGIDPNAIEPQNTEQRIMNVEALMSQKLLPSAFLTLDHVFSVIRYSIFKIVEAISKPLWS